MFLIYQASVLVAFFLLAGFLARVFTLHGTGGIFHVQNYFRTGTYILAAAAIGLLLLAYVHHRLRQKNSAGKARWLYLPVILLVLICAGSGAGGFTFILDIPSSAGAGNIPPVLMMTGTGPNGIPDLAVVAYTEEPVQASLEWGQEGTLEKITGEKASMQHIFKLRNLSPGTEYLYRFQGGPAYRFTTPPAEPGHLAFAVASDAHFGAGDNRSDLSLQMLKHIAAKENSSDYFFFLGDLVEYGFRNRQWQEALQALSGNLSAIPVGFAAGNHDTLFGGVEEYKRYCRPAPDTSGNSSLWYRLDSGNVHFLILDVEWSAETCTEEQTRWLEKQLETIPSEDWTIVLSHGFYYASGTVADGWKWYDNPETIQALCPLFEKYRVDLVFSGHNHHLELLQKSGVTYVICGAFGGIPDPERTYISPASLWYTAGEYAFVTVDIQKDKAILKFRRPDNQPLKEFVIPEK